MYSIRAKGFTLVELMTVVAVLAVLTMIALPSFEGSLRSNRVATSTNEMLSSLALARTEAIRNRRGGGVCSSAEGTKCDGAWNDGWLVWSDMDGDGDKEDAEPVIRYVQGKQKIDIAAGASGVVAFDARGRIQGGAQSIGVKAEGDSGNLPVRCVQVSPTGQVTVKREACT